MSEPNLKAMTQAELLKYLEEDFMPRLLPKLAKLSDYAAENARLKAEVERLTKLCQATSPDGFIHIRDINAAKEGKPSV